ncbi:unnamed protein product [Linum tenue]|uniref:Pectinesterase inhibitor domain-containing protein n=1 Tax=Linum tenue TaxID=586396 RepID=A0AAV0J6D3_9ROSI|nr:unnamed protein product [Linum tenue]
MAASSSFSTSALSAALLSAVLTISLLASTSSASGRSLSGATTNTEFVRTSCIATTYPQLCYNSLAVHATKIQTSAKLMASTALDVTLASAKSTSAAMVKLQQSHGLTPRETAAMRDCVELIRQSMAEMAANKGGADFGMMISDVQTWVSAALTDESTCTDGFGEKAVADGEMMKTAVRGKIETIGQLTSNALALINAYATLHH